MRLGKPTGAAMPLMWAHAEYIKLLRSVSERRVFDLIPEVQERYLGRRTQCQRLEVWKPNRQAKAVKRGDTLRIQMPTPFRLHWSRNGWRQAQDAVSLATALGIEYVDIPIAAGQQAPINFTFFWPARNCREGRDYGVAVE